MEKTTKIRAVMLDIDNTLLDFHKSAEYAMEKAFIMHSVHYETGYIDVFNRINDDLWREIEKGNLTREQLWQVRFNKILSALNLSGDGVAIEKDFRAQLFDTAFEVDGASPLLEYLSKKYKLFAATNAIYHQQINRLKKADMLKYFSGVFVSEKIGFQKPTKEFFDCCFKEMGGILPCETAIIGDSLTADIEGGINYGLKTIWLNKDGKDAKKIYPHFTVSALLEIKSVL